MSDIKTTYNKIVAELYASATRRRLVTGALWGGVTAAGGRIITISCSFFLARILGQQGFGEYGVINSTAGMIGTMAGMGIGQTVTKYVAELKVTDPQRAGRILALSSLVTWLSAGVYASAFILLAPWLAAKTLAAPHLASLLQISAITVSLGVINSVQVCALFGCEAFRANSYVNVASGVFNAVAILLGARFWGVTGAIAAMAAGMAFTVILTWFVVRSVWRRFELVFQWRTMWSEWRILTNYSLPAFLTLLFLGPVNWISSAFLANQPNGYAELGIFNAAVQWQGAMQFLAGVLCTASIPVMAEKIGEGNIEASFRVMQGMVKGLAFITIPVALILCSVSSIIMSGYGADFSDGYWTMIFLVMTGAMTAIMTPIGNFVSASGMMWTGLMFNMGWVLSMLVGSYFLARWGAEGLALTRLMATMIHVLCIYAFLRYAGASLNQKARSCLIRP